MRYQTALHPVFDKLSNVHCHQQVRTAVSVYRCQINDSALELTHFCSPCGMGLHLSNSRTRVDVTLNSPASLHYRVHYLAVSGVEYPNSGLISDKYLYTDSWT